MVKNGPQFTIGIEEEYLLVDKETRSLIIDPPESLMTECEEKCGAQVTSELLRSQIEIGTKVCDNIQEAEEDLRRLRPYECPFCGEWHLTTSAKRRKGVY